MKVWSFEADQIQPDDLLKNTDIVSNNEIDYFLNNSKESNKFFLIAPKGLGKTLILKVKSKTLRHENNGYVCIPKEQLLEKVVIEPTSLSFEDFAQFERFSIWQKIWKICISITICKYLGLKLPDSYESKIKGARDISQILNIIIADRKFFLHRSDLDFSSELAPQLRLVNQPVAIFIDSLDQTLGHLVRGQTYSYSEGKRMQNAINLWANAQLGLLYAIQEICVQHKHVKVFASIRQEAFEMDESDMHLQIDDFATKVRYSKGEIRQMFINNIQNTETAKLAKPGAKNAIERFVGFQNIPHSFVPDYSEDFFDFVYRHTFGRPREVVLIGKRIYDMSINLRDIKSVRNKVNNVSHHEIFEQFKKEIIPSFSEKKLKTFLNDLNSNVFTKDEGYRLDQSQFRFYYKLGLIGTLKKDFAANNYVQEFREANKFNYKQVVDIPSSDFYFTHPAMDDLLITTLSKVYHEKNVIGYKYIFNPPKIRKPKLRKSSCCHFGAGNLGRGLVLPYLNKIGSRIALVNRNSSNWSDIVMAEGRNVIFSDTNGSDAVFKLVHDNMEKEAIDETITGWCNGEIERIFLVTNNEKIIKKVAESSTFITTALKFPAALKWCADILLTTPFKRKINVYPFENEKEIVKVFRNDLKNNKNIEVKDVIADRICSEKTIQIESNKTIIHTTCENYSLVVVNDKRGQNPFNTNKLKKGVEILLTKTAKEFEFYHQRKFWLFNCVHAILSCYCYKYLKDKNIPMNEWEPHYVHLMKELPDINYRIENITQAQILRLISELDDNVRVNLFPSYTNKEIFHELFKYGQDILDRISSNRDQLIRILPLGDFGKKFQLRIRELIVFYNDDLKYQQLKKLQIFDNDDKYREIRKGVLNLQTTLMDLSMDIMQNEKEKTRR